MIYEIDGRKQDNVSFGNKAEISDMRLPRRVLPIHYGVIHNTEPLQFKLVFGAQYYLDRYDLEAISLWLTGHQDYKWLSICQNDLQVEYRCLIRDLTPLSISWLPVAFEASIICDCPYAYGFEFSRTYATSATGTDLVFRNESSVRDYLRPAIDFVPEISDETMTLRIVNHNDNDREFILESIPASAIVHVDNINGIITDRSANHVNLYGGFNMNLFRLVHGDNHLTVYGDGTLTISGRTLHNVSA